MDGIEPDQTLSSIPIATRAWTALPSQDEASCEPCVNGQGIHAWLMNDTRKSPYLDDIILDLCQRFSSGGLSVAYLSMHLRVQHPEWVAVRLHWRRGMARVGICTVDHGSPLGRECSTLLNLLEGEAELRRPLAEAVEGEGIDSLDELVRDGLTDYVAWPLYHTQGKSHAISFASDQAGGFARSEIDLLRHMLPALALVSEIRVKNHLARILLETYVGTAASKRVLAGSVRRGEGVTLAAVVLVCDLRGFSRMSETLPPEELISTLNEYFDVVSGPIEANGGEILKFIGDGLLAIFPLAEPDACDRLLKAVDKLGMTMARLNAGRMQVGKAPLSHGIGVHAGEVIYGNIGSRRRLDFTVIGSTVNVAARLEALTKSVGRVALFSGDFVSASGLRDAFEPMGPRHLHGVAEHVEVFALAPRSG